MVQQQNLYYNLDIANELTDVACSNPERLLTELGVDFSRQGRKYAGPCPVHDGDNLGAFNFYPDGDTVRGLWICRTHGCHLKYKRNLIGLVRGIKSRELGRQFTWNQAIDWLARFNGIKNIKDVKLPSQEKLQRRREAGIVHRLNLNPHQKKGGWDRQWIRKKLILPAEYYVDRGYSPAILDKYDVGYYEPINRVSVPVYDDDYNFCVGFSARSIYEKCPSCGMYHNPENECPSTPEETLQAFKWRNSKDFEASNYLYNYWFAKQHIMNAGTAILVEGPGDVWRLEENGIHIGLGLFGVELKEQQRVLLDRSGALSLIILLDNDEPGRRAALELKKKLGRTYRLFFPRIKDGKDVGELHSDRVTSDIEPYIRKCVDAYGVN